MSNISSIYNHLFWQMVSIVMKQIEIISISSMEGILIKISKVCTKRSGGL